MSAKKTAKPPEQNAPKPEGTKAVKTKGKAAKKAKKVGALDAAAKVLGESAEPMNCPAMIEAMAAKGYWKSPNGQTPHGQASHRRLDSRPPQCPRT